MPTIDLATTQIFIDENLVDVSFEFDHSEVKEVVHQKYRGIFQKERRSWRINRRFAKAEADQIVADIEEALRKSAPEEWHVLYERFKNFACATKRFDIKFSVGGLRLILPAGHAGHYHLKRIVGRDTKLDTWLLPAKTMKLKEVLPLVQRAEKEDREMAEDVLELYEGRTIQGVLLINPEEAAEFNLYPGKIIFADFGFVHVVEPHTEDAQLHYWPFRVVEYNEVPRPGEIDEIDVHVKLQYLPADTGCRAIRKYMSLPLDQRPWPLDVTKANSKWKGKSG